MSAPERKLIDLGQVRIEYFAQGSGPLAGEVHGVRRRREVERGGKPHGRGDANGRGAAHGESADGLRHFRESPQVALDVLPREEPLVHDAQGAVRRPLNGRYDG